MPSPGVQSLSPEVESLSPEVQSLWPGVQSLAAEGLVGWPSPSRSTPQDRALGRLFVLAQLAARESQPAPEVSGHESLVGLSEA